MVDINLSFPDGRIASFKPGITGYELAAGISKSLAKRSVALLLDGEICDLADPIMGDASIEILTRENPRALELIRHDCAHVLAEAVQELWPETQVTIGPVIENGFFYDFAREVAFTPEDLPVIEQKMLEIIHRNALFTKEIWTRHQAKEFFAAKGESYKVELIDAIPHDQKISLYHQGEWADLCRGPHMVSTGQIGTAFKLMSVAGAYWRGDSGNAMLTRIYGTAWASDKDLQRYLTQREEAQKRDHRKLGREMDLFHFQEEGPGVVFWHAKGWTLYRILMDYMRRRQDEAGYVEVNTPQLLDRAMWVASGHWEKYHEHMFITQTEDKREFALKPMNCPGHVQLFRNGLKSYRDLPLKIAEFGNVHRYEPSGALHGLMRVRAFTQDDAHIFCTEEQITEESLKVNDFMLSIYADFGFDDVVIKFSDRPEKRVGSDALWDKAEFALRKSIEASGKTWSLNPGEGAFYGPKLEYVLRDAIGRDWQCGTNQVDFNLPARLDAFYIDTHSQKKCPVMLHRAMLGSIERFIGILIEHHGGHFPLWLAPQQIVVASIAEDANSYVKEVLAYLSAAGLRTSADLRNEKINYKVREHSLTKVPVILVCGMREAQERSVNIRRLGSRAQTLLPLDKAIEMLADEAAPPDIKRKKKLRYSDTHTG